MAKRILSPLQKAYANFFFDMLTEFEVETPSDLSDEKKTEFFNRIKSDWKKEKRSLAKDGIVPVKESVKEMVERIVRTQLNEVSGKTFAEADLPNKLDDMDVRFVCSFANNEDITGGPFMTPENYKYLRIEPFLKHLEEFVSKKVGTKLVVSVLKKIYKNVD
jgi:hypothetical protein